MFGAKGYQTYLITNVNQVGIAAPAAGKSIYVYQISVSNKNTVVADVSVIAGASATERFNYVAAPNGGGAGDSFPVPWILPAATALNIIQDVNSAGCYVTILARIGDGRTFD